MFPLTEVRWAELVTVNDEVNQGTTYTSDVEQYKARDYWEPANGRGDCEDYALAKCRKLFEKGWPREVLRIALCFNEQGTAHAVLTVDTDRGTYVLDNINHYVLNFTDVPYRWLEREVPGGKDWVKIDEA